MKNSILLSTLGVGLYFLLGVLFWGNHLYMLPFLLIGLWLISMWVTKHQEEVQVKKALLSIFTPLILMLTIGGFVSAQLLVWLYIALLFLVALLVYVYATAHSLRKISICATTSVLVVAVLSLVNMQSIHQWGKPFELFQILNYLLSRDRKSVV